MSHEYSHIDNPCTELADCACIACHEIDCRDLLCEDTPIKVLALDPVAAEWVFIPALSKDHASQYPLTTHGDDLTLSLAVCPVATLGLSVATIAKQMVQRQTPSVRLADASCWSSYLGCPGTQTEA